MDSLINVLLHPFKKKKGSAFFSKESCYRTQVPILNLTVILCSTHIVTLYRHMTNILGESLKGKVLQVLVKWVIATTLSTKEAFNKEPIIQK